MSASSVSHVEGISLRQAAIIAGVAYLLNPITYAEFNLYPKIVIPGNIALTVHNIDVHGSSFAVAIFCYLINYIEDIVIAWALYILLAPVNRALSLLTAWFRLIYTALGLFGVLELALAFRLVHSGNYGTTFGVSQLQAQVQLLLDSFRYGWGFSLIVFGVHLILLGYLIVRSGYIPGILGILLALDGLGWIISGARPYLYPNASLGWLFIVSFAELLLPLWLVIMGWRIPDDPVPKNGTRAAAST